MGYSSQINDISVLLCNGNEPLPKQGGMERVTDALARGLSEAGIKVTLLCRNRNRLGETYIPPCPLYFVPKENPRDFIKKILLEKNITHIIDQGEDDFVGIYGYFRTRPDFLDNVRLIAVQHNSPGAVMRNYKSVMQKSYRNHSIEYIYNKWLLPIRKLHSIYVFKKRYRDMIMNYDKLVTLSPSFIGDIPHFSSNDSRCTFNSIPNINTYREIEVRPKENHVLFVGRLINNIKGTDKLLRIWAKATRGIDCDWTLDIVGDGPDRYNLEYQAKALGLSNVKFHGFKDPKPFYEKSKIFCLTSIIEGFGMVLTEAMQHGVVPMAFESYSAVHDIITDSHDGFLVKPFDENAYSSRLHELMIDPDLMVSMSRNAQKSVQKFSEEKVINQWINLLAEK